MKQELKFKAIYRGELHEIYEISLTDGFVTIFMKRYPYREKVKPEKILEYINRQDINGEEIYEGDYDNDGNCVVWCDKCSSWQFAQLDVPTREICIPCHSCDGNFMFDDHIQEFEKVSNRFI